MPSGLFMGSVSTLIYTSELILCSTICVHSATRHNIHMKRVIVLLILCFLANEWLLNPVKTALYEDSGNPYGEDNHVIEDHWREVRWCHG